MNLPLWCQRCGGPLDEHDRCPACSVPVLFGLLRREVTALMALIAITLVAFFGTRAVAQLYADIRERDAAAWYRAGQMLMEEGDPHGAAEALRHASAMARDNQAYRLALAAALMADGRDEAARQILLSMRAVAPEHPEANLRLARLEARRDDETAAVRYYQNALYGVWDTHEADARVRVRIELVEYLLARGRKDRALAELLALEGNLPSDPPARLEAADLFMQAGDPARALTHFEQVLKQHPRHAAAAAGAAHAAFSLGDYRRAERHLRAAPAGAPGIAELREVTAMVLERDPLAPRLAFAERRRRLLQNLTQTMADLGGCPDDPAAQAAAGPLEEKARVLETSLTRRTTAQSLETIETGVDLVYQLRRVLGERCGASGPAHRALVIIGARYQADPS